MIGQSLGRYRIEEKIGDGEPFSGTRESSWVPEETSAIVVDDLDDGFFWEEEEGRSMLRFSGRGVEEEDLDHGLPTPLQGLGGANQWSRLTYADAYGKYRRTMAAVRSGSGKRNAGFRAELTQAGEWELEYYFPGYSGAFQMYEYCFGWWRFDGIPDHHSLKFEPGSDFTYSNYGLEQLALAMRNVSGERVGPYVYDRVLGPIGMAAGLRDNEYGDMPYSDDRELNFAEVPGWGIGGSSGCDAYGADMSESPYGRNSIVGSTFRCTARDFARLAYLWLHRGRWQDRQLVPAAWIDLATRRHVRGDGSTPSNYGYTFWVMDGIEGVPNDLYMSRGHNLNHSFVIPSLDLVVVRQGNDNRRMDREQPFADTLIRRIVAAVEG